MYLAWNTSCWLNARRGLPSIIWYLLQFMSMLLKKELYTLCTLAFHCIFMFFSLFVPSGKEIQNPPPLWLQSDTNRPLALGFKVDIKGKGKGKFSFCPNFLSPQFNFSLLNCCPLFISMFSLFSQREEMTTRTFIQVWRMAMIDNESENALIYFLLLPILVFLLESLSLSSWISFLE